MGEKGVETSTPAAAVSGSGTSGGQNFDEQAFGDLGAAQRQAGIDLMGEAMNQWIAGPEGVQPPSWSSYSGPEAVAKILPGTDAGGGSSTGSGTSSGGTDAGGSSSGQAPATGTGGGA